MVCTAHLLAHARTPYSFLTICHMLQRILKSPGTAGRTALGVCAAVLGFK